MSPAGWGVVALGGAALSALSFAAMLLIAFHAVKLERGIVAILDPVRADNAQRHAIVAARICFALVGLGSGAIAVGLLGLLLNT